MNSSIYSGLSHGFSHVSTRPKAGRWGKWPAPGPADLRHFDDFPFKKLPDAEERGTYGHHVLAGNGDTQEMDGFLIGKSQSMYWLGGLEPWAFMTFHIMATPD